MSDQLQHYTFLCGSFQFERSGEEGPFVSWTRRLPDSQNILNHLRQVYQEPYFNFALGHDDSHHMIHHTHSGLLRNPLVFRLPEVQDVEFQVCYLDRYLLPQGLGLFCAKVTCKSQDPSQQIIADLIRTLRNPDTDVRVGPNQIRFKELIHQLLTPGLNLSNDWDKNLGRLKHYTIVNNTSHSTLTVEDDQSLFELAHAMPSGSVSSDSPERPSPEYYKRAFSDHGIEVYANWKGLALLDSFTRWSTQFDDKHNAWEIEYFHLYVYCLVGKIQIQRFLEELNVKNLEKLESTLDEAKHFLREYDLSALSHRFLPNLIFEKIRDGLGLRKDIELLEKRMLQIGPIGNFTEIKPARTPSANSVIIPNFQSDVFVSFQPKDNRQGWITRFAGDLSDELNSLHKVPLSVRINIGKQPKSPDKEESALVLVPVLSPGYCHEAGQEWQDELQAFKRAAERGTYGLDIRLRDGNVSSRILPVCIYDLEPEDRELFLRDVGTPLRSVDFVYREPGVNRPLEPGDPMPDGRAGVSYRNQVNRIALAIREVIRSMKEMKTK